MPANIAACYIYYRFFFRDFTAPIVSRLIRHGTAFAALSFIRPLLLLIDSHSPCQRPWWLVIKFTSVPRFSTVFIKHCLVNEFNKLCPARFSNAWLSTDNRRVYTLDEDILSLKDISNSLRIATYLKKKKKIQISIPNFIFNRLTFFFSNV